MSRARLPFVVNIARPCLIPTEQTSASRYLAVFLFTALLAASGRAQSVRHHSSTVAVTGVVKDPRGGGIAGAKVILLRSGAEITSTTSDSTGNYKFVAGAGTYAIRVVSPGFPEQSSPLFALDRNPTEIDPIRLGLTKSAPIGLISASAPELEDKYKSCDVCINEVVPLEVIRASLSTMIAIQKPPGDGVIAVAQEPWYRKLNKAAKRAFRLHS